MATYSNLQDPRTYLAAIKEIDKARSCGYAIDICKHRSVTTNRQMAYLNFIIAYFSHIQGQTFYQTLHDIQTDIAPHIFRAGQEEKPKPLCYLNTAETSSVIRNFLDYASMNGVEIPDTDDKVAVDYCRRELESSAGWV